MSLPEGKNRIIVYPKDVSRITGKSERHGRRILSKIRTTLDKPEDHMVTVYDFSDFTGIPVEHLRPYLKG